MDRRTEASHLPLTPKNRREHRHENLLTPSLFILVFISVEDDMIHTWADDAL